MRWSGVKNATHQVEVATEFKRCTNGGRMVAVEHPEDMTEREASPVPTSLTNSCRNSTKRAYEPLG